MTKHRYQEKINDRKFVILSDKDQSYVHRSVKELNRRLSEVSRAKPGISTEDTALLVALNLVSEVYDLKQSRSQSADAERHFHEKELQWKEEIQALKAKNEALEAALEKKRSPQPIQAQESNKEGKAGATETIRDTEVRPETGKTSDRQKGAEKTTEKKAPLHVSLERPTATQSTSGSLFQGSSASALLANHSTKQRQQREEDNPFQRSERGLSQTKRKRH